jgi:hypothetical protein
MFRFLIFCPIIFICLLSGCSTFSPQHLGISEEEWKSYDKNRQDELQHSYYESLKNAKAEFSSNKIVQSDLNNTVLRISITSGKVIMPPFTNWYSYQQTDFLIVKKGSCSESILSQSTEKKIVKIEACYLDGILFLDPSHYDLSKKFGSVRFNYSPLWTEEQGFTYHGINTSGYVRLKGADVTIKSLPLQNEIQSRLLDPIERHSEFKF